MKHTKLLTIILACVLTIAFAGCAGTSDVNNDKATKEPSSTKSPSETDDPTTDNGPKNLSPIEGSDNFTKFDKTISYDPDNDTRISLATNGTTISGSGASVENNTVTISAGGTYILSGSLEGQIIVNTSKTEKVRLVFNGVNITNKTSACVYVMSADKVGITLVENTENTLTDGTKYQGLNEKDEPNACIFSKDDLSINGYGSLVVNGNYNNGITCKNDLKIVSGNIKVTATNNAIKAKDSFSVNKGDITITSYDDGVKVSNENDEAKGFILIEGGNITITAEDDAFTSTKKVTISGGKVTTYCNGKSINCLGEVSVAEGCLVEK